MEKKYNIERVCARVFPAREVDNLVTKLSILYRTQTRICADRLVHTYLMILCEMSRPKIEPIPPSHGHAGRTGRAKRRVIPHSVRADHATTRQCSSLHYRTDRVSPRSPSAIRSASHGRAGIGDTLKSTHTSSAPCNLQYAVPLGPCRCELATLRPAIRARWTTIVAAAVSCRVSGRCHADTRAPSAHGISCSTTTRRPHTHHAPRTTHHAHEAAALVARAPRRQPAQAQSRRNGGRRCGRQPLLAHTKTVQSRALWLAAAPHPPAHPPTTRSGLVACFSPCSACQQRCPEQ